MMVVMSAMCGAVGVAEAGRIALALAGNGQVSSVSVANAVAGTFYSIIFMTAKVIMDGRSK